MIVIDTNILACLYLPGPQTPAAEALLLRDPDWTAPPLWRSEAGHLRRGQVDFGGASAIQREAEQLLRDHEHEASSQTVLECVRKNDCSAYDCEFVALAQELGVQLVTQHRKLLAAFSATAMGLAATATDEHFTFTFAADHD